MMIGYARAEEGHDEDQQRSSLAALGVESDHIHIDRGLRGTRNDLPARTAMLADLTVGDVIAVTGLERLARSAAELGEVAGVIEQRGASLRVGSTVYDPDTETGRTAFAMLTQTFPDFQAGIFQLRLSGPRAKAKAAGRYPGGKAKLTPEQSRAMFEQYQSGEKTVADLQKEHGLSKSGVYVYLRQERDARNNTP
uniref:Transposon resolvase-like protein ResA n=1 Tax=Rhodococcus hoagii TaxID=43767 RepID=D9I5Q3_RHOHA|nr:recombinase family protein [Prescottella equi]ADI50234.1 transposon resolvase-like protein ResA [Prescottella equi]